MRFTKKSLKAIRKWLAKNGFDVSIRFDNLYAYDAEENAILICHKCENDCDSDFIRYMRLCGLTSDFDCATLSLLHELGHAETVNNFTDDEWLQDALLKEVICYRPVETIEERTSAYFAYWDTATEHAANMWAVRYTKTHHKAVAQLEEIIEETVAWK